MPILDRADTQRKQNEELIIVNDDDGTTRMYEPDGALVATITTRPVRGGAAASARARGITTDELDAATATMQPAPLAVVAACMTAHLEQPDQYLTPPTKVLRRGLAYVRRRLRELDVRRAAGPITAHRSGRAPRRARRSRVRRVVRAGPSSASAPSDPPRRDPPGQTVGGAP